jgi:predicted nucleotidyltransferase
MFNYLITSKARVKVLGLFLLNPENLYYLRQVAELTSVALTAVKRELVLLQKSGIIESVMEGKRSYYKANRKNPVFYDLRNMYFKTTGLAEALKSGLRDLSKVKTAFIYGSYAARKESFGSDIDIMVIGDVTVKAVSSALSGVKSGLGRELNFNVFSEKEFRQKYSEKNNFIDNLLKEEKIFLIGGDSELKAVVG